MKTKLCISALALLIAISAFAEEKEKKETERLDESAVVLKEILGMPEGIPKDLLDKAVCIVVYPSVKKAAFIVGGSYGRGVITCRSGKEFTGPGARPLCSRLRAAASASRSAHKPLTLSCSS
jgi:lipid-binding SYLF domain-containing protein